MTNKAVDLSAQAIIALEACPAHVNLTLLEMPLAMLFDPAHARWSDTRSLDASQLLVGDTFVTALAACSWPNLRWLDLSSDPNITMQGVRKIAEAVRDGRLPHLDWLNLRGTSFDATPFVDGSYWRMTPRAHDLAAEFGFQRWMMLGSRQPERSGFEMLDPYLRELPPTRFR